MTNFENNFFLYTNPLLWLYFIVWGLYYLIVTFLEYIGITNWYYVLFKLRGQSEKVKEGILYVHKNRKRKLPWIKRKAWEKAIKIIEDDNH